MPAFLFYDPRPQYTKADGTLCAGGSLTFTLTNTSTRSDVYADAALGTNLGNVITLGSDARSPTPLWGDSTIQYRIRLEDSLGETVAGYPIDDVSGADFGGISIPDPTSGTSGQVLTTNGSTYELDDIRQIPDGTGHDNGYLSTIANVSQWVAFPTIPDPTLPTGGVTITGTTVLRIGTLVFQWGTATLPATGTFNSTIPIVFASSGGIAMDNCLYAKGSTVNFLGIDFGVTISETAQSGTGFSIVGTTNLLNDVHFDSTISCQWFAIGTKAL